MSIVRNRCEIPSDQIIHWHTKRSLSRPKRCIVANIRRRACKPSPWIPLLRQSQSVHPTLLHMNMSLVWLPSPVDPLEYTDPFLPLSIFWLPLPRFKIGGFTRRDFWNSVTQVDCWEANFASLAPSLRISWKLVTGNRGQQPNSTFWCNSPISFILQDSVSVDQQKALMRKNSNAFSVARSTEEFSSTASVHGAEMNSRWCLCSVAPKDSCFEVHL